MDVNPSPAAHPSVRPPDAGAEGEPVLEEFGRWYETYRARLYRYVRWRVQGREIAEDLVARIFLRALRRLNTYRPERGAPGAWLFQIARNTVTDHLRHIRRRHGLHVSIDHIHDLVSDDHPTPEERLLHEERVRRLLNGVASRRTGRRWSCATARR
jgi:RNA polymerase sigma-70 factor (ECF subfamily)